MSPPLPAQTRVRKTNFVSYVHIFLSNSINLRTAISNSPDFADLMYHNLCDRPMLDHQQMIGDPRNRFCGTGSSTEAFFLGRSS